MPPQDERIIKVTPKEHMRRKISLQLPSENAIGHREYGKVTDITLEMVNPLKLSHRLSNWWLKEILELVFSSVAQPCPTLCDPMNCSRPSLPVHHHLPEFTQIHVHRVRDAIQPSHPLSSPSPPVPNLSQHQSLFQWVNSSHEVAKVLELQL